MARPRGYDDATGERIDALRAEGWSLQAIADEFNLTYSQVAWRFKRPGRRPRVPRNPGPPKIDPVVRSRAQELRDEGASGRTIAAELGVSLSWVYQNTVAGARVGLRNDTAGLGALATARAILEDREGYEEAARRTGFAVETLKDRLPGHELTPEEIGEKNYLLRLARDQGFA